MYGLLWYDSIWLDTTILKSVIWGCKKIIKKLRKIAFKAVRMKFLAIYIHNKKLSVDIFTIGSLQNIFMEHDLYLISDNFDPYNLLFAIATNVFMTGFVVTYADFLKKKKKDKLISYYYQCCCLYIYIYIYIFF